MSVEARVPRNEERQLEHALAELTGAILLVSGGRYPEVLISNLGQCRRAIDSKREMADAAGVDLVPIARSDGRGCDVAVRAR